MPKLKTHRGAAKRFKKTGTGKFLRGKAFKQHILTQQDDEAEAQAARHDDGRRRRMRRSWRGCCRINRTATGFRA